MSHPEEGHEVDGLHLLIHDNSSTSTTQGNMSRSKTDKQDQSGSPCDREKGDNRHERRLHDPRMNLTAARQIKKHHIYHRKAGEMVDSEAEDDATETSFHQNNNQYNAYAVDTRCRLHSKQSMEEKRLGQITQVEEQRRNTPVTDAHNRGISANRLQQRLVQAGAYPTGTERIPYLVTFEHVEYMIEANHNEHEKATRDIPSLLSFLPPDHSAGPSELEKDPAQTDSYLGDDENMTYLVRSEHGFVETAQRDDNTKQLIFDSMSSSMTMANSVGQVWPTTQPDYPCHSLHEWLGSLLTRLRIELGSEDLSTLATLDTVEMTEIGVIIGKLQVFANLMESKLHEELTEKDKNLSEINQKLLKLRDDYKELEVENGECETDLEIMKERVMRLEQLHRQNDARISEIRSAVDEEKKCPDADADQSEARILALEIQLKAEEEVSQNLGRQLIFHLKRHEQEKKSFLKRAQVYEEREKVQDLEIMSLVEKLQISVEGDKKSEADQKSLHEKLRMSEYRVNSLEVTITEMRNAFISLNGIFESMSQQIETRDNDLEVKNKQLSSLSARLKILSQRHEDKSDACLVLAEQLRLSHGNGEAVGDMLKTVRRLATTRSEEIQSLNVKLADEGTEVWKLNSANGELVKQVERLLAENCGLKEDIDFLREGIELPDAPAQADENDTDDDEFDLVDMILDSELDESDGEESDFARNGSIRNSVGSVRKDSESTASSVFSIFHI